jgi:chromosomal replication initiator protein
LHRPRRDADQAQRSATTEPRSHEPPNLHRRPEAPFENAGHRRTDSMSTETEIWSAMLGHLQSAYPELCRKWFEDLVPIRLVGGVFYIRAKTIVYRDYLRNNCAEPFSDAARTASGHLLTICFLGPADNLAAPPAPLNGTPRPAHGTPRAANSPAQPPRVAQPANPPAADPWRSSAEALVLNPDYAFENFVVGPENRLAHAAALGVADNPGRSYNPYFVHGDVGLGKTHLIQAICLRVRERNPDARIYYTSCEGFMTQFLEEVRGGEMAAFRHTFRDVDVLAIDDIHFLAKRDRTQEEFFHTFNVLYQAHKQIIMSSDAPPDEIPDLEDRLVSRFKWGLVSSVATPCYETRVAIAKHRGQMRGLDIADDVACYVASRIETNIRELEGAIVRIQVLASVEKTPIDLDLARAALGDAPIKSERQVQIQTIINVVTDFYGVKITDLQSRKRQRSIALPRQVCMFLARKHTRFSLEEIGGYFGGRDHTTVMHAIKTVESKTEAEADFKGVVNSLEATIRGDESGK